MFNLYADALVDQATNPIAGFLLLGFIIFAAVAVNGGEGAKWKLLNLLIVLGFAGVGFIISFAFNEWSDSSALAVAVAVPIIAAFGIASASVCMRQNKKRNKTIKTSQSRLR
jgi:hypothetical protein